MATITPYAAKRLPTSTLLTLPLPSQIPTLEELHALQEELVSLRTTAEDRQKKAAGDLIELDQLWLKAREMHRAAQKERKELKGKGKLKPPKVKREGSGQFLFHSVLGGKYPHDIISCNPPLLICLGTACCPNRRYWKSALLLDLLGACYSMCNLAHVSTAFFLLLGIIAGSCLCICSQNIMETLAVLSRHPLS